jgi:CheY-like chemotaxis protein
VRELQRTILERAGSDVRMASDGVEALDRLGEEPVDLVLTDIEMPRLDGFQLTEAIRAHATLRNIGVLILTSRASDEYRRRGLDAGADGYIVKSAFDEGALLAAVARVLGGPGGGRTPAAWWSWKKRGCSAPTSGGCWRRMGRSPSSARRRRPTRRPPWWRRPGPTR